MSRACAALFMALFLASSPAWGEVRIKRPIRIEYPRVARLARIQGCIELIALISPNGTVRDVRTASGSAYLTQGTKDVLMRWTFDGCDSPQGCEFKLVFTFEIMKGPCVSSQLESASATSEFEIHLPDHILVRAREFCANID